MKFIKQASFLFLIFAAASRVAAVTSISQFGITWTFAQDVQSGQFANGDYWVLGPVDIISISPESTMDANGRTMNGSMVNPAAGSSVAQGFDSAMASNAYSSVLNAARPKGLPLSAENPLSITAPASIVSSISNATGGIRPQLTDAAVLTVVFSIPSEGSFRPPYVGSDKTIIAKVSDINFGLFPKYPKTANTPNATSAASKLERPWIEINTNWTGREMHPSRNQQDYGRDMANDISWAALSLLVDHTDAEKRVLAVRLIQYGIDIYGAAKIGATWTNNGGHNLGRKLPLIIAAAALNNEPMKSFCNGNTKRIFQEDQQTFYVSQAEVNLTNSAAWAPDDRGDTSRPYTAEDIGMPEWGITHYTRPAADDRAWGANYRHVNGAPYVAHSLVARILKLEDLWNWPPFFAYAEKYFITEGPFGPLTTKKTPAFVNDMWKQYAKSAYKVVGDLTISTKID